MSQACFPDVRHLSHYRICIVTVPETHPIRKDRKTVEKVDYKFGDVNRLSNIVIGKGKKVRFSGKHVCIIQKCLELKLNCM